MSNTTGKKTRKMGRNKIWCTAYRQRGRRELNKWRRLKKHCARHGNDKPAAALMALLRARRQLRAMETND